MHRGRTLAQSLLVLAISGAAASSALADPEPAPADQPREPLPALPSYTLPALAWSAAVPLGFYGSLGGYGGGGHHGSRWLLGNLDLTDPVGGGAIVAIPIDALTGVDVRPAGAAGLRLVEEDGVTGALIRLRLPERFDRHAFGVRGSSVGGQSATGWAPPTRGLRASVHAAGPIVKGRLSYAASLSHEDRRSPDSPLFNLKFMFAAAERDYRARASQGLGRLVWQPSDRHRIELTGTGSFGRSTRVVQDSPYDFSAEANRRKSSGAAGVHGRFALTQNLELRLGLDHRRAEDRLRPHSCDEETACDGVNPLLQLDSMRSVHNNNNFPLDERDRRSAWQASAALAWTHQGPRLGDHLVTLSSRSEWARRERSLRIPGDYLLTYRGLTPVDRWTLCQPDGTGCTDGPLQGTADGRRWVMALQDQWRPAGLSTLTLAPRLTYVTGAYENDNGARIIDVGGFEAGLAAQWDPRGKGRTLLRGSLEALVDPGSFAAASQRAPGVLWRGCPWDSVTGTFADRVNSCRVQGAAPDWLAPPPCGPGGALEGSAACGVTTSTPRIWQAAAGWWHSPIEGLSLELTGILRRLDHALVDGLKPAPDARSLDMRTTPGSFLRGPGADYRGIIAAVGYQTPKRFGAHVQAVWQDTSAAPVAGRANVRVVVGGGLSFGALAMLGNRLALARMLEGFVEPSPAVAAGAVPGSTMVLGLGAQFAWGKAVGWPVALWADLLNAFDRRDAAVLVESDSPAPPFGPTRVMPPMQVRLGVRVLL